MILSALVFAALAAAALFILWRAGQGSKVSGNAAQSQDMALLRQATAELDEAIARGDISEADARSERSDLRRRALALSKLETADASTQKALPSGPFIVAAVAIAIAGSAFVLLSDPPEKSASEPQEPVAPPPRDLPVDDFDGLMQAGQARFSVRDFRGAFTAYAAATALAPERIEPWLAQGEALLAAQLGQVTPAAMLAFAEAEKRSPGNPISQYYAGLERLQQGDAAAARQIWLNLRRRSRPGAPWLEQVDRGLAEASRALGVEDEERPAIGPEQIEAMVAGLAARLEEDGDDPQGWLMLARSYTVLGRPEEARKALERLAALEGVPEEIAQQAAALTASLP